MEEIKEKYKTQAEADALMLTHANKVLVEIQKHEDGNFLVFADEPRPASPPTIEKRLAILEADNTDLKTRLTAQEAK